MSKLPERNLRAGVEEGAGAGAGLLRRSAASLRRCFLSSRASLRLVLLALVTRAVVERVVRMNWVGHKFIRFKKSERRSSVTALCPRCLIGRVGDAADIGLSLVALLPRLTELKSVRCRTVRTIMKAP